MSVNRFTDLSNSDIEFKGFAPDFEALLGVQQGLQQEHDVAQALALQSPKFLPQYLEDKNSYMSDVESQRNSVVDSYMEGGVREGLSAQREMLDRLGKDRAHGGQYQHFEKTYDDYNEGMKAIQDKYTNVANLHVAAKKFKSQFKSWDKMYDSDKGILKSGELGTLAEEVDWNQVLEDEAKILNISKDELVEDFKNFGDTKGFTDALFIRQRTEKLVKEGRISSSFAKLLNDPTNLNQLRVEAEYKADMADPVAYTKSKVIEKYDYVKNSIDPVLSEIGLYSNFIEDYTNRKADKNYSTDKVKVAEDANNIASIQQFMYRNGYGSGSYYSDVTGNPMDNQTDFLDILKLMSGDLEQKKSKAENEISSLTSLHDSIATFGQDDKTYSEYLNLHVNDQVSERFEQYNNYFGVSKKDIFRGDPTLKKSASSGGGGKDPYIYTNVKSVFTSTALTKLTGDIAYSPEDIEKRFKDARVGLNSAITTSKNIIKNLYENSLNKETSNTLEKFVDGDSTKLLKQTSKIRNAIMTFNNDNKTAFSESTSGTVVLSNDFVKYLETVGVEQSLISNIKNSAEPKEFYKQLEEYLDHSIVDMNLNINEAIFNTTSDKSLSNYTNSEGSYKGRVISNDVSSKVGVGNKSYSGENVPDDVAFLNAVLEVEIENNSNLDLTSKNFSGFIDAEGNLTDKGYKQLEKSTILGKVKGPTSDAYIGGLYKTLYNHGKETLDGGELNEFTRIFEALGSEVSGKYQLNNAEFKQLVDSGMLTFESGKLKYGDDSYSLPEDLSTNAVGEFLNFATDAYEYLPSKKDANKAFSRIFKAYTESGAPKFSTTTGHYYNTMYNFDVNKSASKPIVDFSDTIIALADKVSGGDVYERVSDSEGQSAYRSIDESDLSGLSKAVTSVDLGNVAGETVIIKKFTTGKDGDIKSYEEIIPISSTYGTEQGEAIIGFLSNKSNTALRTLISGGDGIAALNPKDVNIKNLLGSNTEIGAMFSVYSSAITNKSVNNAGLTEKYRLFQSLNPDTMEAYDPKSSTSVELPGGSYKPNGRAVFTISKDNHASMYLGNDIEGNKYALVPTAKTENIAGGFTLLRMDSGSKEYFAVDPSLDIMPLSNKYKLSFNKNATSVFKTVDDALKAFNLTSFIKDLNSYNSNVSTANTKTRAWSIMNRN